MRDDEIVAKITRGDTAALAAAYDRYAPGLHSYCRMLLSEPDDAAGAAADTFVVAASRLSGLRDTTRLRPWLYAVARNECVRRLRSPQSPSGRVPGIGTGEEQFPWQAEPAGNAALIRDSLQGVSPAEREVLNLWLQDLDPDEIANVLGVSRKHAQSLLSRARGQLRTSLGVFVVAQAARWSCPELDAMLDDWGGRLTPKLRRQIAGHLEHCAVCTVRSHQELTPGILAEAAAPLTAASLPAGLWRQVSDAVTSAETAAVLHRARAAKSAGPFSRRTGFPVCQAAPEWWHRPVVRVGAAGMAVGIVAAAAIVLAAGGPGLLFVSHGASFVTSGAASPHAGPAALPGGSPGTADPTSAGAGKPLTTRPAPTRSASPSPSPSPVQASTPVAQPTVTVSPSTLTLTPLADSTFTITAHGGPVSWSLAGPASLANTIAVSQSSGNLEPGQSVTVTIAEVSVLTANSQLTVNPGGEVINLIAGT